MIPLPAVRITVLPGGVLQIQGVGQRDAGNYRCVAVNIASRRRSMEATLTVTPGKPDRKKGVLYLFFINFSSSNPFIPMFWCSSSFQNSPAPAHHRRATEHYRGDSRQRSPGVRGSGEPSTANLVEPRRPQAHRRLQHQSARQRQPAHLRR